MVRWGPALVVVACTLQHVAAVLAPEQKALLQGTWQGTVESRMVGIKTRNRDVWGVFNQTTKPPNELSDFEPGCLVQPVIGQLTFLFDTSADTFVYRKRNLEFTLSGEEAWIPELSAHGDIVSWANSQIVFQSPNIEGLTRCWAMREVYPAPGSNESYHLYLASKNTFQGSLTGECPDRTTVRCDLVADPPEFVFVARIYKLSGADEQRVNEENGWSNGQLEPCVYSATVPWDLFLPVDCWSVEDTSAFPEWIIYGGATLVILLCCGCCCQCCRWCFNQFFTEIRDEDLPFWMRCVKRFCCCCCVWCYRYANRDPNADEELDKLTVEASAPRTIKVKAHRPDWARKYGDHAKAWKVASSV